jgi:hypothetical protein
VKSKAEEAESVAVPVVVAVEQAPSLPQQQRLPQLLPKKKNKEKNISYTKGNALAHSPFLLVLLPN